MEKFSKLFKLGSSDEIFAKELSEGLGEAILLDLCSPLEVNRFKKGFNLEEIESTGEEYFYLIMFLTTYSCQIVFVKNKDLSRIILDNLHKYITEKKFNLPAEILEAQKMENQLKNRYAQYYELSRTKEHNIDQGFLIQQLPYNFFANVLKKDLHYIFNDEEFRKRWGMSTIKLSLWIRETLKGINNSITGIKEKYKING